MSRIDAFRYGLLIGLKEAGRSEKVAFALLDDLEASAYDLKAFGVRRREKLAGFMGAARGLLGGAKGFAQGLTGFGAKAPRAALRANRGMVRQGLQGPRQSVPAGFQAGAKANRWLGKHPVAAGALGAGGLMLGNRMLSGPSASQKDVEGLQQVQQQHSDYLNDPSQRVADMYHLMQLMQGHRGMGYGY